MLHVPVTQRQGTSTDIHEEYSTPSQTSSEATSSAYSSDSSRTTTSSQREIFSETATEYDASSEASSRETSRPSSPESGNLTVRSVYSPLPEMAIVPQNYARCHSRSKGPTRESSDKEVSTRTATTSSEQAQMYEPDPEDFNSRPSPSQEHAFPRRPRARSEMANGTTSGSSEESDCENPRKAKFLALKRRVREHTSTNIIRWGGG